MTLVRVGLCEIAAHQLARAATIAIRYASCAVKDTSHQAGPARAKILDYASVRRAS